MLSEHISSTYEKKFLNVVYGTAFGTCFLSLPPANSFVGVFRNHPRPSVIMSCRRNFWTDERG